MTALAKDLLDVLVCPACHQSLTYDETAQTLKCNGCRRVYPIRDGIPIMLIDQAKVE